MSTVRAETVDIQSLNSGHFASNTGHLDVHLPDLLHQIIYQRGLRQVANSLAGQVDSLSPPNRIHRGAAVCGWHRADTGPSVLRPVPMWNPNEGRAATQRRHSSQPPDSTLTPKRTGTLWALPDPCPPIA